MHRIARLAIRAHRSGQVQEAACCLGLLVLAPFVQGMLEEATTSTTPSTVGIVHHGPIITEEPMTAHPAQPRRRPTDMS